MAVSLSPPLGLSSGELLFEAKQQRIGDSDILKVTILHVRTLQKEAFKSVISPPISELPRLPIRIENLPSTVHCLWGEG